MLVDKFFQKFKGILCYAHARFTHVHAHTLWTIFFFLLFVLYLHLRYGRWTPSDLFSSYVMIA